MTCSLMYSACGVYTATTGERFRRIPSCLPHTGSPITLQSRHHRTCQHSSEHRKLTRTLTPWRLHLEDTSVPPTSHPRRCLSLRVCSASRGLPSQTHRHTCSHTRLHTKPTVLTDWQELQTVRLHRLHFKPTTTDWQPAEGWLLAGNTCFIYQPAGVCPAHYGCDMYNFEVYLHGFRLKRQPNRKSWLKT